MNEVHFPSLRRLREGLLEFLFSQFPEVGKLAASREKKLLNLAVEKVSDDFLTLNHSAPRI